jgi:hypothetical protein
VNARDRIAEAHQAAKHLDAKHVKNERGEIMLMVCLYCGDLGTFWYCMECSDHTKPWGINIRVVARDTELAAHRLGGAEAVLALWGDE